MIKWDGHTHSPFCKHGNPTEDVNDYLSKAHSLGFDRYSITEHPPLPKDWIRDPELMDSLAMNEDELPNYFDTMLEWKKKYDGRMDVAVGLEIDYLYGAEDYTSRLIDRYGHLLEDALISVHYLPGTDGIHCIDYTVEDFRHGLLNYYGSMEKVADEYYNHVEMAIEYAASWPFRKRLGHINLIEKFRMALPEIDPGQIRNRLERILPMLKESGIGIDVNVAGFRKSQCGICYVPDWFFQRCKEERIPLVYGSDTHNPQDIGQDYHYFQHLWSGADS